MKLQSDKVRALLAAGRRVVGLVTLTMTTRRGQRLCIAALVGVYVLSFFLPVEHIPYPARYVLGWELFPSVAKVFWEWPVQMIVRSFIFSILCGCLANILFAVGIFLLLLRRYRSALMVGVLASLGGAYCRDNLLGYGLYSGYYVWLASMVLLALAGGCFAFMANRKVGSNTSAQPSPPRLPDPGALALFNQPQVQPLHPTEIRSGAPQGDRPSSIQPPCSRSSST